MTVCRTSKINGHLDDQFVVIWTVSLWSSGRMLGVAGRPSTSAATSRVRSTRRASPGKSGGVCNAGSSAEPLSARRWGQVVLLAPWLWGKAGGTLVEPGKGNGRPGDLFDGCAGRVAAQTSVSAGRQMVRQSRACETSNFIELGPRNVSSTRSVGGNSYSMPSGSTKRLTRPCCLVSTSMLTTVG